LDEKPVRTDAIRDRRWLIVKAPSAVSACMAVRSRSRLSLEKVVKYEVARRNDGDEFPSVRAQEVKFIRILCLFDR
jgi:hypothetical protein